MHAVAWFGGMQCRIRQLEVIQGIDVRLRQYQLNVLGYEVGLKVSQHEYGQ